MSRDRPSAGDPQVDRRYYVVIAASLLLLHFQVLDLSGYPFTLGLLLSALVVRAAVRSGPPPLPFAALAAVVGGMCLQALLTPGTDLIAFLRTAVLFTYSVGLVLWVIFGTLATRASRPTAYVAVMIAVDALSWVQYLTGRHGISTFFNPWRRFSYLHPYSPGLGVVPVRAEAFYLEPSFAALVLVVCAAAAILAGGRPLTAIVLCAAGMGAVRSASGIITVVVLTVLAVIFPQEVDAKTRRARRDRRGLILVMGGLFAWLTPYAIGRLTSTDQVGTSANFRLDSPLTLLTHVLGGSVIGEPLGSSNEAVASAGLILGTETGKSLDNGVYIYIFYLGWVGIALAGSALSYLLYRSIADLRFGRLAMFAVPVLLMSAVFTGAVFTPEYAVLVALLVMEFRRRLVVGVHRPELTPALGPLVMPSLAPKTPRLGSVRPPVLVSIVTVTLNDFAGLRRTHASLLSLAGDPRVEWVVWDGCSNDGTATWLRSVSIAAEPGLQLRWKSRQDNGIYDAMNRATALARGRFLWYLNAGDEAVPAEMPGLLAALTGAGVEERLLYGDCLLALAGGREILRRARPVGYLRHSLPTSHQAMMFPRSAVLLAGGYDTSYRVTGDYDLACRLERSGVPFDRVAVCPVRFHLGGESSQQHVQLSTEAARVQRTVRHAALASVALSLARRRLVFAALGALEWQKGDGHGRGSG